MTTRTDRRQALTAVGTVGVGAPFGGGGGAATAVYPGCYRGRTTHIHREGGEYVVVISFDVASA